MSDDLYCREEIIADLLYILRRNIDDIKGPRWEGCEYAKALIGNATLGALRHYGIDSTDAIRIAMLLPVSVGAS